LFENYKKLKLTLCVFHKKMIYTLNGVSYSVYAFGLRVMVDDTWFELNEGKVMDNGRHIYTIYPETFRIELGADYQAWYIDDQKPVEFEEWKTRKSGKNIKNIIIDGNVYQVEGAAAVWPHPKLFLREKHVGYICEDQLVWIGENGRPYYQKVVQ
jgi:hypothetical protein